MNFLFPTFLFGLLAIAIPIIIHLFNFRKFKKIYFTNVQFLKELKEQTNSQSKIKEWLILAMRILAIVCLTFAFAQPFFPSKQKITQGQKTVSIYIDNSFSMENVNKKGTLLENAKQYATDIVNFFNASDKFQLITNDFEGKHQRLLSKEEFIEQLSDVKISSATRLLTDVLKRQQDFLKNNNSKNKQIFILSDFQKNAFEISKPEIDTTIDIHFISISSSEVNNTYIDSVWFDNPLQQFNTTQTLHAIVVNASKKNIEGGTLKLLINDRQVSINAFDVAAGNKKEVSVSFTVRENGLNNCILKISDYPISYDDDFYFSFNAQSVVNTLVINGNECQTGVNFKSLMQKDSLFSFNETLEAKIDYALFSKMNTIILNDLSNISSGLIAELQKFILDGGSIVIFPNPKIDLKNYNDAFKTLQLPQIDILDTAKTKSQRINIEQGLYEGVFEKIDEQIDLPKINEHFVFKQQQSALMQPIIVLQNGQPLLSQFNIAKGKIYLFAISSQEKASNFIKHALFVPTLIKIGVLSLKPTSLYYYTATNQNIEVNVKSNYNDQPLHIIKNNSTIDVIPEQRIINNKTNLFTQNQITDSGHYLIAQQTHTIAGLAFNYGRRESDMNFLSKDELLAEVEKLNLKNVSMIEYNGGAFVNSLKELNNENKLWKLFLILSLLFIMMEVLIIRLFKN